MYLSEALKENKLTYPKYCDILSQSSARLSYWYGREVTANNYRGAVKLDLLSDLVEKMVINNWNYSEQERQMGQSIAKKITHYYRTTDRELFSGDCLFRTFFNLNLTAKTLPSKWFWFVGGRKYLFQYYTAGQWQAVFPDEPLPEKTYEKYLTLSDPSIRIPPLYKHSSGEKLAGKQKHRINDSACQGNEKRIGES